jgi:hypothetical protein
MVAINFKKTFAADVEAGHKLQTIRRTCRAKKGDTLQLFTGQRTRHIRLLRTATCVAVDNVTLTPTGPFFGNRGWWPKDKHDFAAHDGFSSYGDMYQWFIREYMLEDGDSFSGYVYLWSALVYDSSIVTPS